MKQSLKWCVCVYDHGWIESIKRNGLEMTSLDPDAGNPSSSTLPLQSYLMFALMLQASNFDPFSKSSSILSSVEPRSGLDFTLNAQGTSQVMLQSLL